MALAATGHLMSRSNVTCCHWTIGSTLEVRVNVTNPVGLSPREIFHTNIANPIFFGGAYNLQDLSM